SVGRKKTPWFHYQLEKKCASISVRRVECPYIGVSGRRKKYWYFLEKKKCSGGSFSDIGVNPKKKCRGNIVSVRRKCHAVGVSGRKNVPWNWCQ
ncbi:unnamed protein product, partial [Staurois parvus]